MTQKDSNLINFDKEINKARELLQKENQKKLLEKEAFCSEEISKLAQKYEKKILGIFKKNEGLEDEISKLNVCINSI